MTLSDEKKQPILRNFHELALTPGWNFTESGPNEADRQVLVEFNVVGEELHRLDKRYLDVIMRVTRKMENGMADYAHRAATTGEIYIKEISEYNLYCHYVAGVVGEGLTEIWAISSKEAAWMSDQLELANSMGLFLQKINIIRDYREDADDRRFFWPKEIWGREIYGKVVGRPAFQKMEHMWQPGNEQQALWVLSGMAANALEHALDALDYLRLLKEERIFAFCAVPQTMAIATLHLCFMNYDVFQKNVKIRKAEAASLIMRSSNIRDVAFLFREYVHKICNKARSDDPSYTQILVACHKIEKWCEHYYPGGAVANELDRSDDRARLAELEKKGSRDRVLEEAARAVVRNGNAAAMTSKSRLSQITALSDPFTLLFMLAIALGVAALSFNRVA